jgi:hypothetical protein
MIVYGLAIEVGEIHELPLPRLLDIKIRIMTKFSNRSPMARYAIDTIDPIKKLRLFSQWNLFPN